MWTLLFKLVSAILGLAASGLLARLLSKDDLGVYFLIVSIVTFMSVVVQMGLSKSALRFTAQSLAAGAPDRGNYVIRLTSMLVFLAGILLSAAWLIGLNNLVSIRLFNSIEMGKLGWLTAIWFIAFALRKHFAEIFRGAHDIRLASLFDGAASSALFFLILLFFFLVRKNSLNLSTAVVATLTATLLSSFAAAYLLNRKFPLFGRLDKMHSSEIWPVAWPIFLANLAVYISNHADLWILGSFVDKEGVALYGAALRTVLLISFPMLIINSVIQPMIVELYTKGDSKRLEKMLGASAFISSVPSIILLLAIVVGGKKLLAIVFGPTYADASLILTILCAGRAFSVVAGSCGQCLMLGGYQKMMMNSTVLFGVFSIVLSLLTVERYGPVAVALSFAAGTVFQNLIQALQVKRYMGVSTFANLKWLDSVFPIK